MEVEFNHLNHATWAPQILGTRILCHDGWAGRGSDPDLHQKPKTSRDCRRDAPREGNENSLNRALTKPAKPPPMAGAKTGSSTTAGIKS